jgi:hypothetical protein
VSVPASPPFEWLDPQDERVTRNRIAVERVSVFIKAVMLTLAAGTWAVPRS